MLFGVLAFHAEAQDDNKIDSLLNVYNSQEDDTIKVSTAAALYNSYLYNEPIKAKEWALKEWTLSKEIGYEKGISDGIYHLGVYYNNLNNGDSAEYYYRKAHARYVNAGNLVGETTVNHGMAILQYSRGNYPEALDILHQNIKIFEEKIKDTLDIALSYDLIGSIHMYMGNYRIALKETLKALKLLEQSDSRIRMADALNHMGAIEFNLLNFEKSIDYNTRALNIYREANDKVYEAQALNDLGNTYYYMNSYDKAQENLEQSLVISTEMNIPDLQGTSLSNLGKVATELEAYDDAIAYFEQSMAIHQKTGQQYKIMEVLNYMATTHNAMGQPDAAVRFTDQAIDLAEEANAKNNLKNSYLQRSKAHALLGNYKKAYEDRMQLSTVNDSIFNETKSQQIEELRTIYETEKKEQQIVIQENEIQLLEQKAKVSNLQRILLASGLGLSLLIFGLGFYAIRQKMKRNRLEREKIQSELAFKKKELTTHALHLAKKNEVLEGLKQKVEQLRSTENARGYKQLIQTIDFDLQDDNNWENFARYFQEVHKDFNSNVKRSFPDVTPNELRLMALLKMNLSSKEIANILNISPEGIKKARYRLRKKLDITSDESLQDLVLSI